MGDSYRQQYNFNSIFLLPTNIYGPGDHFEPERSHVIPAIIRKFVGAKAFGGHRYVELWGSGAATRDFIYVEDAAHAIVEATLRYNGPEPLNLGSGHEVSVFDLAHALRKIIAPEISFWFNTSQPDGQPRRCLDTTRAYYELGWVAETSLEEGLRKTVEWYEESVENP